MLICHQRIMIKYFSNLFIKAYVGLLALPIIFHLIHIPM